MNNYEEECDDKGVDPLDFLKSLDDDVKYDLINAFLDDDGDILGIQSDIKRLFEDWINDKPSMIYSKEDEGDQNYEIAKDNKLNRVVVNDGC